MEEAYHQTMITLNSDAVSEMVTTYQQYRSTTGAKGIDDGQFCNGELEVDEFLTAHMELVWFGHFYVLFPNYWMLDPSPPPSPLQSETTNNFFLPPPLELMEKAKVRYVCNNCGHTWTSINGQVYFWALPNYHVHFDLLGAQCGQCGEPDQAAIWYPDEVIRVLNNLWAFLKFGLPGRKLQSSSAIYRRGYQQQQMANHNDDYFEEEEEDFYSETIDSLSICESLTNSTHSHNAEQLTYINNNNNNNNSSTKQLWKSMDHQRNLSSSSLDSGTCVLYE